MGRYYKEKIYEDKTVKGLRITTGVLFFIQVIMTTFPFIIQYDEAGNIYEMTAFQMFIQVGGYQSSSAVLLALIAAIFVVFPIVAFFFCILDKKSTVKYLVSALCCIICALLITFGIGTDIASGSLISLLLYVLILFLTMLGLGMYQKHKNDK